MAKFYPVLKKLSLAGFSFFAVTFAVYYFNLDMKLTAAMEPVLEYFYDKVDILSWRFFAFYDAALCALSRRFSQYCAPSSHAAVFSFVCSRGE